MMKVIVYINKNLSVIHWIKRVPGFGPVPHRVMYGEQTATLWKISPKGIIYYRLGE